MKINYLYLPLLLAFICSFSAMAQENELSKTPLFDYEKIRNTKIAGLPYATIENPWYNIDQIGVELYSYSWVASWLGINMKPHEANKNCNPLKNPDENFGASETCTATLEFQDNKKQKFISYTGKWTGCASKETYIFHQHTPHQIFSWLTQQEDWFCEIRQPKKPSTKRQTQSLLSNEEHPTYIFDFQVNKNNEIVFLEAVYGSEGFSLTWRIKKGSKGSTILEFEQQCAQNVEEE